MRDVLREQQLLDIVPRAAGALYVMRNLGFDAVARRMVDLGLVRIEESVVIDGLRSKEEIEFLVNLNFRVEVVCLSAPYNLRYARACHRKRDRDELSATGFHFEETLHLIMAGAPSFEELANVVVVNSGPIADLHSQADLLAEKFF